MKEQKKFKAIGIENIWIHLHYIIHILLFFITESLSMDNYIVSPFFGIVKTLTPHYIMPFWTLRMLVWVSTNQLLHSCHIICIFVKNNRRWLKIIVILDKRMWQIHNERVTNHPPYVLIETGTTLSKSRWRSQVTILSRTEMRLDITNSRFRVC